MPKLNRDFVVIYCQNLCYLTLLNLFMNCYGAERVHACEVFQRRRSCCCKDRGRRMEHKVTKRMMSGKKIVIVPHAFYFSCVLVLSGLMTTCKTQMLLYCCSSVVLFTLIPCNLQFNSLSICNYSELFHLIVHICEQI